MLAGFNHNVKHKGKLYHVQTEDSGVANPHVITHLFVGGNILASKRTSYADLVGAGDLAAVVRPIMEQQHKEMLRNLVNGVYDEVDSARGAQARAYQPGQIAVTEPFASAPLRSGRTDPAPRAVTEPAALRPLAREEKPQPVVAAPARPAPPAPAPPARAAPPPPVPAPFGSAAARPTAAAKASPAPPRPAAPPLRPALTPPPLLQRTPSPPPPQRAAPAPPTSGPPPLRAAPPDALRGADLLDERSLDEVILSYLAEDLGGRK
ncbi:MAG: hypothetical protein ACJ79R_24355 [Anaeromyxobacteraceae bacterium]